MTPDPPEGFQGPYKATVITADGMFDTSAFDHDGHLWLVVQWQPARDGQKPTPKRVIRLDALAHQRLDRHGRTEILVQHPLPRALRDDPLPLELAAEYDVEEVPPSPE